MQIFHLMQSYSRILLVSLLILISPSMLSAQMFSVEEPERRARPSANAVLFGYDFTEMTPRADDHQFRYEFDEPVYQIRLELPGLEAYAGFRQSLGDEGAGADTLNYLNLGAALSGGFTLIGNRRAGFLLPARLSTDFTRVRSDRTQPEAEQFRQSSVSVGIGAGGYLNIGDRIRIRADMIPQIGFTVSALGSDSGQVLALNGKTRLHFDRIIRRYGLVIGYNYNFRRYSGGISAFNYDIQSNNFVIGINF